MDQLIKIDEYPVKDVLSILLSDKTTKKNIIWATDTYSSLGPGFGDKNHIEAGLLMKQNASILQPRISKSLADQQERTRKKAEVMTPVWICNKMNNYADEEWFGKKDVFNHENEDKGWTVNEEPVAFDEEHSWRDYVDSKRLEITCGEAPYIVSRYDTTTGELIEPAKRRVGMLDRKLRVVNENAADDDEWLKWTERAVQSCYGYEYQGDNLLIARINVFMTFYEHYVSRTEKEPDVKLMRHMANIISWNFWQMDGLKDTVPLGKPFEEFHQMSIFDMFEPETEEKEEELEAVPCRIFNWRNNESVIYRDCKRG